jgi:hypothetical protein
LETDLHIDTRDGVVRLLHREEVIAEGRPAELDVSPPSCPTLNQARAAARTFLGFAQHSFPHCFVCGTDREPGDGLRLFAGPLGKSDVVATPWIVDASLADGGRIGDEFVWAALDCPSSFAVLPAPSGKSLVLGELSARIDGRVCVGEKCVVIGWPIRIDGRKRIAGSAVFGEVGTPIAVGFATWIEVPEHAFPPEETDQ